MSLIRSLALLFVVVLTAASGRVLACELVCGDAPAEQSACHEGQPGGRDTSTLLRGSSGCDHNADPAPVATAKSSLVPPWGLALLLSLSPVDALGAAAARTLPMACRPPGHLTSGSSARATVLRI